MKKIYYGVMAFVIYCSMLPSAVYAHSGRTQATPFQTMVTDTASPHINDVILLPMTLTDFNVQQSGHNCYLTWRAVREEYSPPYSIERSIDGKNYSEVGTTKGKGKEIGMQLFSYLDNGAANLGSKVVFYRLRQLNAEGKSEYTHVIAVTLAYNRNVINLFPNPATDHANLVVDIQKEEKMCWMLADQFGRTLKTGQPILYPGSARISIDLNGLSSGIYFVRLKSTSINSQLKLLKL